MQPRQGSGISVHSSPWCKQACTAEVVCSRQKRTILQGRQVPSASGNLPLHLRGICGNSCSSIPDPSSWQPPVHHPFLPPSQFQPVCPMRPEQSHCTLFREILAGPCPSPRVITVKSACCFSHDSAYTDLSLTDKSIKGGFADGTSQ